MEEKINILQLSPRYVFPADDGGKIGIANITKEFANSGAEVSFFTYDDGTLSDINKKLIEPYAELILFNHSTENTPGRIFLSLIQKDALYINKHQSSQILNKLKKIVQRKKYNIIHADHSAMAPLALWLKENYNIPVGLRLHNLEWTIWQRYANILPKFSPKRMYIQSQANKLKRNERRILEKVDVAFAITDEDKQRALELSNKSNIVVASAGVNLDEWLVDDSVKRDKFELILATTYKWRHNVDAVRWFIENVMTRLKRKYPEISLRLLGKNIPEDFHKYEDLGVLLTGYVASVRPYLNKASIYISPLFVGGGIRIKILEALAMELPVIASPVAAEGIAANENDGLFIADRPDDFIASISKLIEDDKLRFSVSKNARDYVARNFSWKNNVKKMLNEYYKLKNN